MSTQTAVDPQTHDEAIAALYHELAKVQQTVASATTSLYHFINARKVYTGRGGAFKWDVGHDEAIAKVESLVVAGDERNLSAGKTPSQVLAKLDETRDAVEGVRAAIEEAEEAYEGWSRFFLVTSSAGHIHSSMHCSSCRPTTSYGWLPNLSGKTEGEAVAAHGPALCSVCFASAPVEMVGGKITAAQAAKKVA